MPNVARVRRRVSELVAELDELLGELERPAEPPPPTIDDRLGFTEIRRVYHVGRDALLAAKMRGELPDLQQWGAKKKWGIPRSKLEEWLTPKPPVKGEAEDDWEQRQLARVLRRQAAS
jgi:hypothetical protein